MKRKPVESSMLASAGYDPKKQLLELEFTSGQVYHFYDVPAVLYKELMEAPSHGSYFNDNIKDRYLYTKISR